jgi:4-amino-4-deoxy-L-arabinose transferase-like glycosyltransferase
VLAGLALAGGVLTKGLLGLVLPLAVFGADAVLSRDLARLRRFRPLWCAAAFLLAAAPWHVMASLRTPQFAHFYFVNEHLLRYLGKREPHDYYSGPPWYYLVRMPLMAMPWSFLLPAAAVIGFRSLRRRFARRRPAARPAAGAPPWSLCTFWLLVPLILFSVSSAKANYYMVVSAPAVAALSAVALLRAYAVVRRGPRAAKRRLLVSVPLLLQIGVLTGAAIIAWRVWDDPRLPHGVRPAGALLAVGGVVFLLPLTVARRRRPAFLAVACCVASACFTTAVTVAGRALEHSQSSRPLARAILAHGRPDESVVVQGSFENSSGLAFYLRRRIVECEGRDGDLEWGKRWERERGRAAEWFVHTARLPEWSRGRASWLYVAQAKHLPKLQLALPDATIEPLDPHLPRTSAEDRVVWRVTPR